MRDAIALERQGVPSVVLVTRPFLSIARSQAHFLGASHLRLVAVEHPVSHVDQDGIEARAEAAVEAVAAALLGRE